MFSFVMNFILTFVGIEVAVKRKQKVDTYTFSLTNKLNQTTFNRSCPFIA